MPKRRTTRTTARVSRRSARRKTAELVTTAARKVRKRRALKQEELDALSPYCTKGKILALDTSSVAVGWSIFTNGGLRDHGVYRHVGESHDEKMFHFHGWLLAMLAEHEPNEVIYEAPYSGARSFTFPVLVRYVVVVEMAAYFHYRTPMEKRCKVPAKQVKKWIGAKKGKNHEENKKIVLLMVNQEFGLSLKYKSNDKTKKVSQDDEADAIALNWAYHLMNTTDAPIERVTAEAA